MNPGHPKKLPSPAREPEVLRMLATNLRSAPSIPNKFQASGYENHDGKLVPQQPLKAGFSGLGGDTVGPGDYDPPVMLKHKNSAPIFSKV